MSWTRYFSSRVIVAVWLILLLKIAFFNSLSPLSRFWEKAKWLFQCMGLFSPGWERNSPITNWTQWWQDLNWTVLTLRNKRVFLTLSYVCSCTRQFYSMDTAHFRLINATVHPVIPVYSTTAGLQTILLGLAIWRWTADPGTHPYRSEMRGTLQ